MQESVRQLQFFSLSERRITRYDDALPGLQSV
jgi:hypothetical protein